MSFIALHVSAAVSASTADDELPGQGRAVPGQAPAICHQTFSPQSTLRDEKPQCTHGVRKTSNFLLPSVYTLLWKGCLCPFFMQLVRGQTMDHSKFGATFTPKSFTQPGWTTSTTVHTNSKSPGERVPWRHCCNKAADTNWADHVRLEYEAVSKCALICHHLCLL